MVCCDYISPAFDIIMISAVLSGGGHIMCPADEFL